MASEDMGLVPSQRLDNNGINPQLLFPEDSLRFNCGGGSTTTTQQRRVGDPGPKTRELTGFIDEKMFGVERDRYFHPQGGEYRRSIYMDAPLERRDCPPQTHNWNGNGNGNGNGSTQTHSGDGSEDDEDDDEEEDEDDDDDEVDEGDGEVEGLVGINEGNLNNNNNANNSSGSVHSSADKIGNETSRHHSSFGSSREVRMTDGNNIVHSVNINNKRDNNPNEKHQQGRTGSYQNAATMVEPDGDMYYSHFINGSEGSAQGQKDMILENGYGVVGRKDVSFSSESGESLKTILSDPLTGALMDDAMILPCGHSFGGGGIQHVLKMKACYTCSQSISEEAVQPNLSLRAAVLAYCRDKELHSQRASKRRRDKFENKGNYGDLTLMDGPRGRGVQFPFVVTDRVIIKGNKRTPQRFVGREAVVTTQCLNGWYVVKTLDNAESVKLQYRSLAKVGDNPSSKPMSSKMIPNWL